MIGLSRRNGCLADERQACATGNGQAAFLKRGRAVLESRLDGGENVLHDLNVTEGVGEDGLEALAASTWSEPAEELHVSGLKADSPRIAVLLPCHNEATTVAKVVTDFQLALPTATIYVYDNASTDGTGAIARSVGAVVRAVPTRGKGNVIRRMFSEIDADVYVLTDGDDTYDAKASPYLVERLVDRGLDMVVGARVTSVDTKVRLGHRLGNRVLTRSVHWLFGDGSVDMLSGYRVLSRRYVRSFPALSCGFETETEMTIHAVEMQLPFEEVATEYRQRTHDSVSKLRTVRDGLRITRFILLMWKDHRPMKFFGLIACLAAIAAVAFAWSGHGDLHAWTPATFAVAGCAALAGIALLAGLVLDSVGRRQREVKRMLLSPGVTAADFPRNSH